MTQEETTSQIYKNSGGQGSSREKSGEFPLVTVVTVCLNAESIIEKTIRSVLEQEYDPIEYIIIDGGSDDDTLNIIDKYSSSLSQVVSEPDTGIYDAMNKGVKLAKGEWINFLNAGDVYYGDRFLVKNANKFMECDEVLYSNTIFVPANDQAKFVVGKKIKKKDFLFKMPVCHQSIYFPRYMFSKIGLFNDNFKVSADHEWMLRYLKNDGHPEYVDDINVYYGGGGFSVGDPFLNAKEKYIVTSMYFSKSKSIIFYCTRLLKIKIYHVLCASKLINQYRMVKRFLSKIPKLKKIFPKS